MNSSHSKVSTWTALGSTLLAILTHGYLALQSYRLKSGMAEKSICNINAQFNCDAVALSSYAQFLGIPMAIWGATTNLILLLLLILAKVTGSERTERASFWMAFIVVLASVVMGTISTLFMHNYCLFCIITYALSAVQLIAIWKAQSTSPFQHLADDLRRVWSEQVSIPVLFIAVPVGAWLSNSMIADAYGLRNVGPVVQQTLFDWKRSTQNSFTEAGLRYQAGTGPAKMVIVEFADFLCPHCKHAAPVLHNFAESHPDVVLLFKPFPLDGTCNSAGINKGDGLRCRLANLVFCAENLSKKGWLAFDWIFKMQEQMAPGRFAKTVQEVASFSGTTEAELNACIESSQMQDQVAKMAEEGALAKVPGTPAIYVEGRKLERGYAFPVLEAVYQDIKNR